MQSRIRKFSLIDQAMTRIKLTDELLIWAHSHEKELTSIGIEWSFVPSSIDDATSARIDHASDSIMARATVWDAGYSDLEAVSVESGEQIYYEHVEFGEHDALSHALEKLVGLFR